MAKELQKEGYWRQKEDNVLDALETSRNGLNEHEAKLRLKKYGYNILKKKRLTAFLIFLRQFKSPLVWILVIVSIISIFFGELINAIIIIITVLLASMLSFYNEYKSERIVEELNKKITHRTTVIRDGEKLEIDVKEVVPGDVIYLNIGSIVPADLRLIWAKGLEINEAVLTGESMPVKKSPASLKLKKPSLSELENYAFAGTIISAGECVGVVVKTGEKTEFGKIAKEASYERPETEFQKEIRKFGDLLLKTILVLVLCIFFINALIRHDILNSLLFALAIAIGLTPELLPMILTLGLSHGAHIMAKKEVIVKRLISIEDFGNMDVLCTDKTGTLTEGNISLYQHFDVNEKANDDVLLYSLICNSAVVHGKKIFGNPLDISLLKHSKAALKEKSKLYKKIDDVPFDYDRKRMSVVVKKDKNNLFISKGAVQSILKACTKVNISGKIIPISSYYKRIERKFTDTAKEGFRIIAVAYKEVQFKKKYGVKDENDLIFLGFVTFIDPPKKTVKKSIGRLAALGVKFKILTGDNELVTKKIAREIKIPIGKVLLGNEIDDLDDEKLREAVEEAHAFCRLTPMQKQRIIKALKQNGHDVGFMGDGVNDVPALHEADVAISVNDAVDVAKESSDIILLRKSLNVLADGVVEGRKIFGNTMKYIMMGTSSNFGNMFSAAGASLFLPFLPMLPIQILLVNLLYDVSESTIPTDNVDKEYIKKPKRLNIGAIKRYMLFFGPISSIYDFFTYFVMIFVFSASMALFQTGWFIESMITQVFVVFVIRTRKIPFFKSKPGKALLASSIIIALVTILIPFTGLGKIFGFTAPPLLYFGILILMVVTYLVLVEIGKYWFFKKYEI